ncbi:acyltransferase [Zunongwangia sp.]|uniref:acyltransferase n=1 Tax=Zunongwangia sp. TaxID=1965325 RepID=UPI003AA92D6F
MILQKLLFKIRTFSRYLLEKLIILPYSLAGLKVGNNTRLGKPSFTWPHQVSIGNNCLLEKNIFFRYDGVWSKGPSIIIKDNVYIGSNAEFNISDRIVIGENSLIASGCKFVDHDHGYKSLAIPIRIQPPEVKNIVIKNNVWLGFNVIILKGVTIGEGAIVAAGSVVTKSIPDREIWGGIPAKNIRNRVDENVINNLRMS